MCNEHRFVSTHTRNASGVFGGNHCWVLCRIKTKDIHNQRLGLGTTEKQRTIIVFERKKKMQKIHLIIIDPQNDFAHPDGSLYVPGADTDMKRLADLVYRLKDKLTDIHVTLDSHHFVDISHPIWFKDSNGNHPAPFTQITATDLEDGKWATTQSSAYKRTLEYLKFLETDEQYLHFIWPVHCEIASFGHCVEGNLFKALQTWEKDRYAVVNYITKGSNIYTEHFSAISACKPDADDPSTQINTKFIKTLEEADTILLAGEARSHCIAHTVRDIVENFSNPKYIEKMVLLTDAMSDVPGFEILGEQFVEDMVFKGIGLSTTKEYLA